MVEYIDCFAAILKDSKEDFRRMALNKVEICGVNTAKLPLLKQEEKDALWERISQGDKEARELYIKGNLRLVLRDRKSVV